MENIVELNVGGKNFTTTTDTLSKSENGNFFTALFSNIEMATRDKNGLIFIDRSPKLFEVILEYCRTSYFITPLDKISLEVLLVEAEFYCMTDLVDQLNLQKASCEEDIIKPSSSTILLVFKKYGHPWFLYSYKAADEHDHFINDIIYKNYGTSENIEESAAIEYLNAFGWVIKDVRTYETLKYVIMEYLDWARVGNIGKIRRYK